MKVKPKYDLDDIVYVIVTKPYYEKKSCPICDGKAKVTIKLSIFPCPKCGGSGYIRYLPKTENFIEKYKIVDIHISHKDIEYHLKSLSNDNCSTIYRTEHLVFLTESEASEFIKTQ